VTDRLDDLRQQSAKTAAQRRALQARVAQTVDRLAPPRLAQDAIEFATDMVQETRQQVRANPLTAAGVVAVAAIAVFNRPLGRLVDRWLDRIDPPAASEEQPIEVTDAKAVSDD
jgi:ElaB/YqjD/DUF883 family membrane-anchored ribosome-binding protein